MKTSTTPNPRIVFLLVLAIAISILFYQLVASFVIALLMAAVLAGLTYPLHRRLAEVFRGRDGVASAVTVLLSLLLVVTPVTLFLGVLVNAAVNVSDTAGAWVTQHVQQPQALQQRLEEIPALKRLLPYQDPILEKVGELAGKAGAIVAQGVAAGARGTAEYFLMLFVMLYAMFYFLIDGRELLQGALRFTPLTEEDKNRLVSTFLSVSRATLKGTLVIGIVQGGLAGAALAVAGIGGAVFWGAVMAILSVIPGVGTALVWIPAAIYLALNGQTAAAAGVALWCAIVVGTADNVLRPILVGKDTEMPDLLVLLTTLGGLILFGISGIVLGPVVGALFLTVWRLWGAAVEESPSTQSATVKEIRDD